MPKPKTSRLRFTTFDAAEISDEPEFLIDGILPREGIGVVYAPLKAHKTFTVFDMAMHVALGRPYRGRTVQYGAVVYNVFEGQHGFLKRAVAYCRHHLENHVERVRCLFGYAAQPHQGRGGAYQWTGRGHAADRASIVSARDQRRMAGYLAAAAA